MQSFFIKKSSVQQLNFFISSLFIGILVLSFFYYYQYGDDFIFLNLLRERNVFETIIYKYLNWDGRHFSFGGLMQMIGFAYLGPTLSLLLGLIFLGISIGLCLKLFLEEFDRKEFFAVMVLFLIGLFPFYKDVLFWQTGIIYLYFFFQSVVILFLYKKCSGFHSPIISYSLVFLMALNSQNFNLAVLGFIWVNELWSGKKSLFERRIWIFTLLILLGTLVISFAPGNFNRIEKGTQSVPQVSNFIEMFFIYLKAMNYTKFFFILGIFGGVLFKSKFQINEKREIFSLAVAGLISLAPFLLYPDLARVRVFFSMGAFLFFSGLILGSLLSQQKIASYLFFLSPLVIGTGLIILIDQFSLLKIHSKEISERHDFLLKESGKDKVYYNAIERNYDLFIIRSPDYTQEWTNEFLEYYGIGNFVEVF